jgi:hypothetical protein
MTVRDEISGERLNANITVYRNGQLLQAGGIPSDIAPTDLVVISHAGYMTVGILWEDLQYMQVVELSRNDMLEPVTITARGKKTGTMILLVVLGCLIYKNI